jgi:hypothetical protein
VGVGQHRTDQADDGGLVGKDPDDAGAALDLLVDPLEGVVGPDLDGSSDLSVVDGCGVA